MSLLTRAVPLFFPLLSFVASANERPQPTEISEDEIPHIEEPEQQALLNCLEVANRSRPEEITTPVKPVHDVWQDFEQCTGRPMIDIGSAEPPMTEVHPASAPGPSKVSESHIAVSGRVFETSAEGRHSAGVAGSAKYAKAEILPRFGYLNTDARFSAGTGSSLGENPRPVGYLDMDLKHGAGYLLGQGKCKGVLGGDLSANGRVLIEGATQPSDTHAAVKLGSGVYCFQDGKLIHAGAIVGLEINNHHKPLDLGAQLQIAAYESATEAPRNALSISAEYLQGVSPGAQSGFTRLTADGSQRIYRGPHEASDLRSVYLDGTVVANLGNASVDMPPLDVTAIAGLTVIVK